MIEHNKSFTQFSYIDNKGNMIDITDKCPIELCQTMRKVLGDDMFDESLVDKDGDSWYLDEYGDKGGGMDMDYMWNYR